MRQPMALVIRAAALPSIFASLLALAACAGASTSARVGNAPVDVPRYGRLLAMADARRVDTA
jgi:hypothetical protein